MSAPALFATPRVLAALRARLLGDAALVAGLSMAPATLGGGPAVYSNAAVPADARSDYLVIGPFTERDASTLGGGWGSDLTVMIKLVTESQDVSAKLATMERLVELLHAQPFPVHGYQSGYLLLNVLVESYAEWESGKVLTHYPSLWDLHVSTVA